MGRKPQAKPRKLAIKLYNIRMSFKISQQEMANRLNAQAKTKSLLPGHVSQFESGKRLPSFLVLLAYAKLARISSDVLIDDQATLPDGLVI